MPARQAHKRVDTKVSTLLRITHFLRGHGADCRHVTASKRRTAEDFSSATDGLPSVSVLMSSLFAVSATVLLHRRFSQRRRDIPVSRKSLARCNARHLRIRRLVQFICVGPVSNNALKSCAALLCRALRRVAHLCSRTVSDTANTRIHERTQCVSAEEKILCRSPASQRSHVGNLRRAL